jgi:hypothetical protein
MFPECGHARVIVPPLPDAMAQLRILTFPRLLVRYSPVPDFRNSLYTIPVSTSVVSRAR